MLIKHNLCCSVPYRASSQSRLFCDAPPLLSVSFPSLQIWNVLRSTVQCVNEDAVCLGVFEFELALCWTLSEWIRPPCQSSYGFAFVVSDCALVEVFFPLEVQLRTSNCGMEDLVVFNRRISYLVSQSTCFFFQYVRISSGPLVFHFLKHSHLYAQNAPSTFNLHINSNLFLFYLVR